MNPLGNWWHGSCKFGISKLDSDNVSLFVSLFVESQHKAFILFRHVLNSWSKNTPNKLGNLNPKSTAQEQSTEWLYKTVLDITSQLLRLTFCTQRQFTGFPGLSEQNLACYSDNDAVGRVINNHERNHLEQPSKDAQNPQNDSKWDISQRSVGCLLLCFEMCNGQRIVWRLVKWSLARCPAFLFKVPKPSLSSSAITDDSISLIACGIPGTNQIGSDGPPLYQTRCAPYARCHPHREMNWHPSPATELTGSSWGAAAKEQQASVPMRLPFMKTLYDVPPQSTMTSGWKSSERSGRAWMSHHMLTEFSTNATIGRPQPWDELIVAVFSRL